jgi:hypothetical protein
MNQEEQLINLKYNCLIKLAKAFLIDLIAINFTILVNICLLIHLLIKNYFDCIKNSFKYGLQIGKNIWTYFEVNLKLGRYSLKKAIQIITSSSEEQLQALDKVNFKNQF